MTKHWTNAVRWVCLTLSLCLAAGAAQGLRSAAHSFVKLIAPRASYDQPRALPVYGNVYAGYGGQATLRQGFGFSAPPPPVPVDPAASTCGLPPAFCSKSRYRTFDGSCNNLQNPTWGLPHTPFGRLIPHNYGDGISAFPVSSSGRELPLPRVLSLLLFPSRELQDPVWNLNAQQWGQIITHDMSLGAGATQSHKNPTQCCTEDGQFVDRALLSSHCFPLVVPEDDPVHAQTRTRCMNFVRTVTTRDRRCVSAETPVEQLSSVTDYMDMSLVYGTSEAQAASLRAGVGGRLAAEERGGKAWPPRELNSTVVCESALGPDEPCYLTGDVRVNQNPQLTLLQIVLLREHNRVADALAQLNPHWPDDTLFHEARRIAVAEFQHINYYEWLPIFLGVDNMVKNRLIYPGASGYVDDYDSGVDPSVLNEHATAAFRYFHSLIAGNLELVNERRASIGSLRLSDWFNRPGVLEVADAFESLARGLATQPQKNQDQFFDSEITQFLFKRNNTFGGDLRAIDIQRSRDHGLATYNAAREACGLPRARHFRDLADLVSDQNIRILQSLYESVEDVELTVGGSLEAHVAGALAGPTFLCILTEQFYRTRKGDRYFYENGRDADIAFTPHQLEQIRKASVARLLCDNSFVRGMQPRAFQQVSDTNRVVPCEYLPVIDLTLWRDASQGAYQH